MFLKIAIVWGAASVGFIEWKDSGGGRAGFFGNNSSGNDDLFWKNEQGGNIGIETTGAGKVQINQETLLATDGKSKTGFRVASPLQAVDIAGDINFDSVDEITLAQAQAISLGESGGGTFAAGEYHYDIIFETAEGETSSIYTQHGLSEVPDITVTSGAQIAITNIPVSSDPRVTKRQIWRTVAGELGFLANKTATINDNTTTTYMDTGDAAGSGAINFQKANTTAGTIWVEGIPFTKFNQFQTYAGFRAGEDDTGSYDVALYGNLAGFQMTTANSSAGFGTLSLPDLTTGIGMTSAGYFSGRNFKTGRDIVSIGSLSGVSSTGTAASRITFVGASCGDNSLGVGDFDSSAFGYRAARNFAGSRFLLMGKGAGNVPSRITGANEHVVLGALSGQAIESDTEGHILVGFDIEPPFPAASDQLNIGNVIKGVMTSGSEYVRFCGDTTNYSEFEADGTLEFNGTATVFKDINVGAVMLSRPAASQPDEANYLDEGGGGTGITTLAFAIGEKVSGSFEMQHDYKEGSNLVFHVHWQGIAAPSGTDNVQWRISYTLMRENTTLDAVTTIDTTDTAIDTQYKSFRSNFAAIDGATKGNNGSAINIEDQFLFTLERVAATGDAYVGDALVATVGIHYEHDTVGSRTISTK